MKTYAEGENAVPDERLEIGAQVIYRDQDHRPGTIVVDSPVHIGWWWVDWEDGFRGLFRGEDLNLVVPEPAAAR